MNTPDDQFERSLSSNLSNVEHDPFTPAAFQELQVWIATYVRGLVSESKRTAHRRQNDGVISKADVQHAAQYLSSARTSRVTDHVGTLGGIFFGAGLGNLVAILGTDKPTAAAIGVTVALCVVGAAMVVYQVVSDR